MDTDGDGLTDAQEESLGTHPTKPDTDFDGLRDGEESTYGTNPLDPDSDDGCAFDGLEVLVIGTDPLNGADDSGPLISDSDRDGVPDQVEDLIGCAPASAFDIRQSSLPRHCHHAPPGVLQTCCAEGAAVVSSHDNDRHRE